MSRRRVIIWCGGAISAAALCYFFPLFRVEPIAGAAGASQSPINVSAPANVAVPLDVTDYADHFWNDRLRDAFSNAVDVEELFEAVDRDPRQARSNFGRQVGLGGALFFFVRGAGHVEEVAVDHCTLKIGGRSRRVSIRTGVVVGNAVRNSTGLIDVNQFANSQDFNNLSADLNRRVEVHVIAPSRERLRVGVRVDFVGCSQIDDDCDFDPLSLIPVHLDIEHPEVKP